MQQRVVVSGAESSVMEEISALIHRAKAARTAQSEKRRAFDEIVRRFQDLAFGCAYAVLGDFQRAEDAAQEAFIVAWRNLDQLRQPEAFPGWFKRIVLTQCNRQTRNKQFELVSFETAHNVPSLRPDPESAAINNETRERVLAAINSLQPNERMVTTLFYVNEYSQNEIAEFLELPLSTIKKRLYCARQQLRQKMLDIVRDTLSQQRPSRDRQFANTVALYNDALDSFLDKVKQDRYVLAIILFGSMAYDQVWEKSDIDLMLIGRDEKLPIRNFCLIENGVNIHAILVPRSKFKQLLEGQLQSSFTHSAFSKSTLLYTTDETIREYYQGADRMGPRDTQLQLLRHGQEALYTLAKAEKWYHVKRDLTYSFLWILYTVTQLAHIEVIQQGEVTTREVIHQALKHNPEFFNAVYFDLVHQKKDEAAIQQALQRIDHYIDSRLITLFRPVLEYLEEQGGIRSTTDLDAYFKKQVQTDGLSNVYEWLADKGVIQKVPSPRHLHEKSRVVLEEAAYYYDGRFDNGGMAR